MEYITSYGVDKVHYIVILLFRSWRTSQTTAWQLLARAGGTALTVQLPPPPDFLCVTSQGRPCSVRANYQPSLLYFSLDRDDEVTPDVQHEIFITAFLTFYEDTISPFILRLFYYSWWPVPMLQRGEAKESLTLSYFAKGTVHRNLRITLVGS
jgi:hypothetical protein